MTYDVYIFILFSLMMYVVVYLYIVCLMMYVVLYLYIVLFNDVCCIIFVYCFV